ncbi:DUF58 domain-containing protein [Synechococcales cyanobacterium C]|uniref:DUF58 domain-containing protein n=1 Tax=Petrachloros mirabilis ULC683 TaxID=2781853 RepID=A0A8K2A8U6_9CYAN|nr:DUF58 domain-containing protein [Petrachloros mirabilis]NCJ08436.1 DUF58 domain-containing protein [Petrachloros mirabilis ULC683]
MKLVSRFTHWLEMHWAIPAYAGWVLLGLTLFFLLAAANTLAGWLYVLSGLGFALLGIAAVLPGRSLRGIAIQRQPLYPVSAGDSLTVTLTFNNPTPAPKSLLMVQDHLPAALGSAAKSAIEVIPAHDSYTWTYAVPTRQRGVYRWQQLSLRTAAPLGLFWSCRQSRVPGKAMVYPTVLPLSHCPLIDQAGCDRERQMQYQTALPQASSEGATRSLRPYRWGDPLRLVHWRSSARYNELRIRELEIFTSGQQIVIALDSLFRWHPDDFEQAVIAAASLYTYAHQHYPAVQLWTAGSGIQQTPTAILETLAQVQLAEDRHHAMPRTPVIWMTQNPESLTTLPQGSLWLLWSGQRLSSAMPSPVNTPTAGRWIYPEQPLHSQLQAPVTT